MAVAEIGSVTNSAEGVGDDESCGVVRALLTALAVLPFQGRKGDRFTIANIPYPYIGDTFIATRLPW